MKYFLSIFCIVVLASCNAKQVADRKTRFIVKDYSYSLDRLVQKTFFYRNHYFSITDGGKFLCLTDHFSIDSGLTEKMNQTHFEYVDMYADTLFAINTRGTDSKVYYLDNDWQWQPGARLSNLKTLFEDKSFQITSCCFGEFGGSVFFREIATNRVYSCPATCAIAVNKLGSSYFITSVLNHMDESSSIIKVDNPLELYELISGSHKNSCNWWYDLINEARRLSSSEHDIYTSMMQNFSKGTDTILDSSGVLISTSFVFADQLYHILPKENKLIIGKIQADSIIPVDTLLKFAPYFTRSENQFAGTRQLCSFRDADTDASGFLTISNDTISIVTFRYR